MFTNIQKESAKIRVSGYAVNALQMGHFSEDTLDEAGQILARVENLPSPRKELEFVRLVMERFSDEQREKTEEITVPHRLRACG